MRHSPNRQLTPGRTTLIFAVRVWRVSCTLEVVILGLGRQIGTCYRAEAVNQIRLACQTTGNRSLRGGGQCFIGASRGRELNEPRRFYEVSEALDCVNASTRA